jgi:hypothetical protein
MTPSSSPRISARLAALGFAVLFLASACVNVAPIETTGPQSATPRPTSSGQPNVTPAPTLGGEPTTPGATLEPGATPGPTTPGSSAPPIDPAVAAEIDAVVQQMPPIRELDELTDVPYEFITRQEFTDGLLELQFSEIPQETRDAEERLYKRLGLLPDDADIDELLVELYGEQAAAYYRPDTKRFYIISDSQDSISASDEIIVAHEYTHALQDQHFDLEAARIKDVTQGDAALGQLGAVEGDATLAMQLWTQANLSPDEALEVLMKSLEQLLDPTLASTPWILRRELEFPYAEGFSFIQGIYDQGGFDAVNATLSTAIPASTEQVLHPEKYLANEAVLAVDAPDISASLGSGWTTTYEQTIGELLMQVVAAGDESPPETIPGLPMAWPHAESVDGWGGDRLKMYENGGQWLIDWHTAWDTQADADEFIARVNELTGQFDGPALVIPSAQEVRVMIASDQSVLDSTSTN